eukprot:2119444-Prymnesium_polylepis.1
MWGRPSGWCAALVSAVALGGRGVTVHFYRMPVDGICCPLKSSVDLSRYCMSLAHLAHCR